MELIPAASLLPVVPGSPVVGSAWLKVGVVLDTLEEILLAPERRTDIV